MKFAVWYLRPKYVAAALIHDLEIDPKGLERTHAHLVDFDAGPATPPLEAIYEHFQTNFWSAGAEKRRLLFDQGLDHSSMCVGDVLVSEDGHVNVVEGVGFRQLN